MFLRGKSYAVLGIAFFSMLIRFPFDLKQFHNVDEGVIGTLANIILRGGLVYRDGWCHRGPLLDYTYAGIFTVFGNNNMVAVHLVTSFLIALQVILLYRMASLLFSKRIALIASFLFGFFSTFGYLPTDTLGANVEIWMNFFILAGLNLFIPSLTTPAYLSLFLSTMVIGLAPVTKQVAFSLYPFLILLILFSHTKRTGESSIMRHLSKALPCIVIATIGFFMPLAMTMLYYHLNNALSDFMSLFVYYNFFYIKSFYLPNSGFTPTTMVFNAAKSVWVMFTVNFSPKRSGLLYAFSFMTFFIYLIGFKKRITFLSEERRKNLFFIFLWFLFSIMPLLALGRGFGHYFIQLLPIVSILAAFSLETIFFEWQTSAKSYRLLLAIIFFVSLLFPMVTFFKNDPLAEDKNLNDVAEYIQNNSNRNDTIFVWGWNTELYVMTNRQNASRFIFCTFLTNETPGAYMTGNVSGKIGFRNALNLWLADLQDKKPKFIIEGHRGVLLYEIYPLSRYSEIFAFISSNYRVTTIIGNYRIFEKMNQ